MRKNLIYIFSKNSQKGFSLIELMVVVVVLSLVIIGLVTFFTGGTRSWIAGQSQLKAQREARQAMDIMVREIREGKEILAYSDTSVKVKVPVFDENGVITDYNDIEYIKDGTTLKRDTNPFIENVKTFTITKLDESQIRILLEVDVDNDENIDISLNSEINLRNYGLGS